jgi:hypothetical protein
MPASPSEALATLYERLAPDPNDLVSGKADANVFETFKDLKTAAHPDRIGDLEGEDFFTRGLLAHALFLDWQGYREAKFLADRIRNHMVHQLRDEETPHHDLFRLLEALTRFCDAWKRVSKEED